MNKLQNKLQNETMIISDPISIQYLTGYQNDPGERMMVLLLTKDTHLFILNEMFPKPQDYKFITYKDSENPILLLDSHIHTETIWVDGNFPARFLLPLIHNTRTFQDGSHLIEALRSIKSEEEINLMIEASKHNDRIMGELLDSIYEGMTEIELASLIKEKQSTPPLSGISFEPIAVFTENIADPHAIPSDRKLKKGDAILIDMGGVFQNYHSDMTRTFFFGSNDKISKLYDIVLEANLKAIEAIEIGKPLSTVDKAARDVIESHGYGQYFTHRTGHGIGLETHENLDVSSTNDTLIQVGMCFSIEPGIYLEGVGGVRIEDLICITKSGPKVINYFTKEKIDIFKRDS